MSVRFEKNKNLHRLLQWYYRGLKAAVHYIPVASDISDLALQMRHAKGNDARARQLSQRASQLAAEALHHASALHYLAVLIRRYADVQSAALDVSVRIVS